MRKICLWIVWLGLAVIYVTTIWSVAAESNPVHAGLATINIIFGLLLFFAEGFEIAFAMLWPQRSSLEKDIHNSFKGLDPEFVLAQRQVVVVVTITAIGVNTSALPWIQIPILGRFHHLGPSLFSLVFTTLTVLWFCQVFPKRIAARFPERFWRFSVWLLRPINIAGRVFDLPAPSHDLVMWWESIFGRPETSHDRTELMSGLALWSGCGCAVCSASLGVASLSHTCDCAICSAGSNLSLALGNQIFSSGRAAQTAVC